MPLTSALVSYDPRWPQMYADEAARLAAVFADRLIALHHVGSTAVPGLVAKPEIDILAEVGEGADTQQWDSPLADLGYRRGGDLSPDHLFFKRDVNGVRTHKLHVCTAHHPDAQKVLAFRNLLRADPAARERYGAFKQKIATDESLDMKRYLSLKEPFIAAMQRR
ncbi:GrpB family protein [Methylobacterium terrae]|uniref:GrpB family protein n=1 Tax=Methylobacterium terrae TaxID=2202827 RepID=A0A2U8WUZ0_9HYPH|nr:GrpB family protein [Methylobacterium terrae]AWN49879.1 GrpB family protein [Methylobacterium terrae]